MREIRSSGSRQEGFLSLGPGLRACNGSNPAVSDLKLVQGVGFTGVPRSRPREPCAALTQEKKEGRREGKPLIKTLWTPLDETAALRVTFVLPTRPP